MKQIEIAAVSILVIILIAGAHLIIIAEAFPELSNYPTGFIVFMTSPTWLLLCAAVWVYVEEIHHNEF